MPSWHDRFVTRAKTDGVLRRKLHELARLDALAMSSASQALSDSWMENAARVERLCDEVAQRVAQPGEEVDEVAQWISYNCQGVVRSLPPSGSSIGAILPFLLAIIGGGLVYRWYHSWIAAVMGGLAVLSLSYWIRSIRRF